MNQKFVKSLKLVCRYRKQQYPLWIKAFKTMPTETQNKFKVDLYRDAKKIRQMSQNKPPSLEIPF